MKLKQHVTQGTCKVDQLARTKLHGSTLKSLSSPFN